MSQLEIEDEVATDLQRATGTADAGAGDSTRLNRVLQLTGALRAARVGKRMGCGRGVGSGPGSHGGRMVQRFCAICLTDHFRLKCEPLSQCTQYHVSAQ